MSRILKKSAECRNDIISTMSRYLPVAIVPLILLWPIWDSWIFTIFAPSTTTTTRATITTTVFDTFILTSTIPPTTTLTLTITTSEEARLRLERWELEKQEHIKGLKQQTLAWQQERDVAEAERLWEKKIRESWSVWFMDYLYYPVAWFLVGFVGFCMVVDWEILWADWTKIRGELREQMEKERLEEERKRLCHACTCCEKAR
jgi:hypothetical protein